MISYTDGGDAEDEDMDADADVDYDDDADGDDDDDGDDNDGGDDDDAGDGIDDGGDDDGNDNDGDDNGDDGGGGGDYDNDDDDGFGDDNEMKPVQMKLCPASPGQARLQAETSLGFGKILLSRFFYFWSFQYHYHRLCYLFLS